MIWIFIIVGLVALLTLSKLKPNWFKWAWDTTLANVWIASVALLVPVLEYMQTDPTWKQTVPDKYEPYIIVFVAVLLILIRRVNVPKG